MQVTLTRYSSAAEDTLGLLFVNGSFCCYTLEDQYQDVKIPGETRIPAGRYRVILRAEGGFHARYAKRFPGIHRGMLQLQDVPGFEWVLIHCGNDHGDTGGCLLVGDGANNNQVKRGHIGPSVQAYRRVYPPIASAILQGEEVWIEVSDGGRYGWASN